MSLPKFLSTKPVLGSLALLTMALAALFITLAMPHSAQGSTPPPAPTGLTAPTVSHNSVRLNWADPGNIDIEGYVILRRDTENQPAGTFTTIDSNTGSTATTYTDATVEPETRYVYRVKAIGPGGTSEWSNYVTITTPAEPQPTPEPTPDPTPEPPPAPTGLTAPSVSHDSVTLSWDDPADSSIEGFVILRRNIVDQQPGTFTTVESNTGSQATTYTDGTVEPETKYAYRIQAIGPGGTSGRSNYVNVTTGVVPDPTPEPTPDPTPDPTSQPVQDPPGPPEGLVAGTVTHESVTLTWSDPGDSSITGYQVLRRFRDGTEYGDGKGSTEFVAVTDDTGSSATSYTDTSVTPRTRYVYRVKARNPAGLSTPSPDRSVTVPPKDGEEGPRISLRQVQTPPAPTGIKVSLIHLGVSVEWDFVPAFYQYQIRYRKTSSTTWDPDWTDVEALSIFSPFVEICGRGYPCVGEDLEAGVSYTFQLRRVNQGTAGTPAEFTATPVDNTAPAPANLAATTSPGSGRVALSWDDPSIFAIRGYEYRVSANEGRSWNPNWTGMTGSDRSTTSYTVEVPFGDDYTIEVRARLYITPSTSHTARVAVSLMSTPTDKGQLTVPSRVGVFGTISSPGERHRYTVELAADKFYRFSICGCYTNETGFTKREIRLLNSDGTPVQIDGRDARSAGHGTWSGVWVAYMPSAAGTYLLEVRAKDIQSVTYHLSAWNSTITASSADEGSGRSNDFDLNRIANLHPGDPVSGALNTDGERHGMLVDSDYFRANLHAGRTYTFTFSASSVSNTGNERILYNRITGPDLWMNPYGGSSFTGASSRKVTTFTPRRTGQHLFVNSVMGFGTHGTLRNVTAAYTVSLQQVRTLHSTTMTVGSSGDESGYSSAGSYGSLSAGSYNALGESQSVTLIAYDSGEGHLAFRQTSNLVSSVSALVLGGVRYRVSDAANPETGSYTWDVSDPGWSDGDTVSVEIIGAIVP